jgi:hypothetical protein
LGRHGNLRPNDRRRAAQEAVHDRRGAFQAIRLCVDIVGREPNPLDAVVWLEMIERAAEDRVRFADELDAMQNAGGPPQ